jgi:hypothetical protein
MNRDDFAVTLHYSEALVSRAVKLFWWRVIGWRFVGALLLVFGSFLFLVASGDRSWFVGFLGTVLVLGVSFALGLYLIHYRGSLQRLRRMRCPEATLELGKERFRISSDVGTSELAWSAVTELWSFPDLFLVFLSRAQFMTIPTDGLDTEVRDFIVHSARSHGARVA